MVVTAGSFQGDDPFLTAIVRRWTWPRAEANDMKKRRCVKEACLSPPLLVTASTTDLNLTLQKALQIEVKSSW
jgi:hypothetical protein